MKTQLFFILLVFCQPGCKLQKSAIIYRENIVGMYKQNGSSKKLELKIDGSYILYNAPVTFTPGIEQCEYASKGRWSILSPDILAITSENYYLQQEGFKYELNKENKLSQDSLYIKINLPDSLIYYKGDNAVNFSFTFNNNVSRSIFTNKSSFVVSKQKHLGPTPMASNLVAFSLNADISGTTLYKSRILFEIFKAYIDTEKTNYLTITLPNFDLCFFEFEPYEQELIFIKNEGKLIWLGNNWEKVP